MISQWRYFITDQKYGEPPADVVITVENNKIKYYKFQRNTNFCFHEQLRDYIFKYSPSVEFLVFLNYLKRVKDKNRIIY